jgi:hypothetical protein
MARFASSQASQNDAINTLADVSEQQTSAAYLARTAGAITLSAAQIINGIVNQSGTPGAFNMTTPTAAAIVAALKNCQIGTKFEFVLMNGGDGTVTIVAGDGVTLAGVTAVPTVKTQIYRGVVTAVATPAVTLVGLLRAPI